MAWNWLYGMLGMPVRAGEEQARRVEPKAEPRRLRPLGEPAGDEARAAISARLAELRAKHRSPESGTQPIGAAGAHGSPETPTERLTRLRAKHGVPAVERRTPESLASQRLATEGERREFDRRMADAARARPSPPGWPRGEYGGQQSGPDHHHLDFVPRFTIDYEDYQGDRTRRRITIQSFVVEEQSGEGMVGYIKAWCDLRRDARTFRVDRILAVIDDDGVVHDDPVGYLSDALGLDLRAALE